MGTFTASGAPDAQRTDAGGRDHRAALAELQELAPLPNCLTYGELKLPTQWDDLRHEPLFDKVLAVVAKPATID